MSSENTKIRELVLASASPRRRELLAVLGVEFSVVPANIDETVLPGEAPRDYVRRMALEKALAGAAGPGAAGVLGCDTAVIVDDDILGKPADRQDGMAMLARLSGRSHQVLSAVVLVDADGRSEALSVTEVSFRAITEAEAAAYWASGEPADKAGGYGIQGIGAVFVAGIKGSYTGVVGLPLFETAALLGERGYGPLLGSR